MKKMRMICLGLVFIIAFSACSAAAPRPVADGGYSNSATMTPAPDSAGQAPVYYNDEYEYEIYPDEEYLEISENKETNVLDVSTLTFSLKVDTASYNNIARYIDSGSLPPEDAVRIEEMINYFNYDEILQENDTPFSIYTEIGPSPFDENKQLAFVRVKSKDIDKEELPRSNLTFLIDTSGSMNSSDKLPLLKSAFGLLVDTLTEDDVVSIVTYAGSAGVVLDSVNGSQKDTIMKAINNLKARGSTAGAQGITTAYALAEKNFDIEGNNRVILATDGDFNVGVSSVSELENLIKEKRGNGIYLSILGFGTENLKDNKMETIAKNGKGNYSYIDSIDSAKKVLVDELSANLYAIADDVKAQVEFNPALVGSYRLIGYENRRMSNRDFDNDKKDAGIIGVGTDVVLMFELELNDGQNKQKSKYQSEDEPAAATTGEYSDELFEVRIRYKDPGEGVSKLITEPVKVDRISGQNTSDFNFAASVAGFGHLLRNSEYKGDIIIDDVLELARDSMGKDKGGYRKEYVELLKQYKNIIR